MTLNALVQPLRFVEFFQGLSPAQLHAIAACAERVVFKPGDAIIKVDEPAAAAILIVSGEARRVDGPGVGEVEVLPQGTLVGEMGMLVETIYSSTVVAATSVRALRFVRDDMLKLMTADASVAEHFVAVITARLRDVASEMRDIDRGLELAVGAAFGEPATAPLEQGPHLH
ncbi:MAG: Crp/Fnr family transcriptional regulator [Hyphomicrobiaceae bacterium]